jgi:23S rRNA (adenine2503-C2)-methyltransferase
MNLDEVTRAARVFSEPSALAIDARAITVCTAGLPDGIRALARELPNVRVALSIGAARPEVRRALMPRAPTLKKALEAVGEHAEATGRAPLFSYTLLAGKNDGPEDAASLADIMHEFVRARGVRPRLTLVAYNPIGEGDPYRRASPDEQEAFWHELAGRGVRAKKRYSGGSDVGAACGQLTC